jgi:hypothetical protein
MEDNNILPVEGQQPPMDGVTIVSPEVEKPAEAAPVAAQPQPQQYDPNFVQMLAQQNMLIQQQLAEKEKNRSVDLPKTAGKVPIEQDADGNFYVDANKITDSAVRPAIDTYHNTVVAPVEDVITDGRDRLAIENVEKWLKTNRPDDIKDADSRAFAKEVYGMYRHPDNKGTELEKTNWAIDRAKKLVGGLPSGNPTIQEHKAANQVGRTTADSGYPPKGAEIRIFRTTASEMGLDAYMKSIEQERYYNDLNARTGSNYKIMIDNTRR